MTWKIQVGIAGKVIPALKVNQIAARDLVRRLKNSVCESAGVYEIRLRLYLWELSGKTRQKMVKNGLNSAIPGKMAFLIVASYLFAAGGILMAWQSRNDIGQGVQNVNTAAFEPFYRSSHPAPGPIGRSRHDGFVGYKTPRDSGAIAPAIPEMARHRLPSKNAIKAHARIVCSSRDLTSLD